MPDWKLTQADFEKWAPKLSFREREIIKLRYGIGTGYTYTLEEVGRIFKITRERVRQIETRAFNKIQRLSKGTASGMKKGTKTLMVPLRRVNRGIKTDPQYSPYMPSYRYIVFLDYGHPTELWSNTFRTKREAVDWIDSQKAKEEATPCQTSSSQSPKSSGPDGSKKETPSESPSPEKSGDSTPGGQSQT